MKAKECQAFISPIYRQIRAQRKIDVEPLFGQKGFCGFQEKCKLRGKRQVRIDMGLVLMANNLLKHSNEIRTGQIDKETVKSISKCFLERSVYYSSFNTIQ